MNPSQSLVSKFCSLYICQPPTSVLYKIVGLMYTEQNPSSKNTYRKNCFAVNKRNFCETGLGSDASNMASCNTTHSVSEWEAGEWSSPCFSTPKYQLKCLAPSMKNYHDFSCRSLVIRYFFANNTNGFEKLFFLFNKNGGTKSRETFL